MPDALGRATNYDMASRPLDLSDLPEFAFSPKGPRAPMQRIERKAPPAWHGPMVPATLQNRVTTGVGKADPTWDTAFSIKFVKKHPTPADPLKQPFGTVAPSSRIAELDYLIATPCCDYHAEGGTNADHVGRVVDLATDYDTFVANGIEAQRLTADDDGEWDADIADTHLGETPYAVRLPNGEYGGSAYIANMKRRIEWEKWFSACGPVDRAAFAPTKSGEVGIVAFSKSRDGEFLLALRRHVKNTWLDQHADLPDVNDIVAIEVRYKGARILDFIEPDALAAAQRYWSFEDSQPGRDAFHADPDPKPQRSQYPEGHCIRCYVKDSVLVHIDCSIDGWERYAEDLAVWEHVEFQKGEVGYAGPAGMLGIDIDAVADEFE